MNTKIAVQLYAAEYSENDLVKSILNKKLGFEISFENDIERSRRILSLEEIKWLRYEIEEALRTYEEAQVKLQ